MIRFDQLASFPKKDRSHQWIPNLSLLGLDLALGSTLLGPVLPVSGVQLVPGPFQRMLLKRLKLSLQARLSVKQNERISM
jgi:hypothetical protein